MQSSMEITPVEKETTMIEIYSLFNVIFIANGIPLQVQSLTRTSLINTRDDSVQTVLSFVRIYVYISSAAPHNDFGR